MLRNFFKITFRNLHRNKLYATINTLGLALGLAVSCIIFSWIAFELGYDKFNADYNRIYRVVESDEGGRSASISPAVKTEILDEIPEVEYATRIFKSGQLGDKSKVTIDDHVYVDDEVFYADSTFFKIFSFKLLEGNPDLVLQKPNAVVLTEKTAKKYFGDDEPVGKTILVDDSKLLEVTGVFKDLPAQSHFHFDLLVSMKSHPWGNYLDQCGLGSGWMFHTYFKIYPNASPQRIEQKCNQKGNELIAKISPDYKIGLKFQPLTDIHLRSALEGELEANIDIRYIYLFASIALLVIVIAAINYVNLATAYSFGRAREVGVKKVLGARKKQLVIQYLGESLLLALFALFIAVLIIELAHPLLASFTAYHYNTIFNDLRLSGILVSIAVATGLLSGIIPSFVLSSMQPKQVLKSSAIISERKGGLRKILVIFQFSVSLLLLTATAVIYQQLNYLQTKKLGYDKSHVVILYTGYPGMKQENLKNALSSDSRVHGVTGVSSVPFNIETNEYIDTPDKKQHWIYYMAVDNNFFKTLDIHVILGKENIENLSPDNYQNKYVLNRAALKEIGWSEEQAVNQQISIRHGNMKPGPVIGIIEDFHFQSLHYPIRPLVLEFGNSPQYLLVKINGEDTKGTLNDIRTQWNKIAGNIPFEYSFLDQDYDMLYKSETRTGKLFIIFATIATLIAMMGIFGLSSFAAFKRTKEIGIRKVFGATSINILRLLSADFVRLVVVAFIIAMPLAWLLIHKWLQEFAYKVNISPVLMILAGLVVLIAALATVGYHAIRAAHSDPVKTLRYE